MKNCGECIVFKDLSDSYYLNACPVLIKRSEERVDVNCDTGACSYSADIVDYKIGLESKKKKEWVILPGLRIGRH